MAADKTDKTPPAPTPRVEAKPEPPKVAPPSSPPPSDPPAFSATTAVIPLPSPSQIAGVLRARLVAKRSSPVGEMLMFNQVMGHEITCIVVAPDAATVEDLKKSWAMHPNMFDQEQPWKFIKMSQVQKLIAKKDQAERISLISPNFEPYSPED